MTATIQTANGTIYIDQIGEKTFMVLDHTFDVAHFFDSFQDAINFLNLNK